MLSQTQKMHPKAHTTIKDLDGVYLFLSPEVTESFDICINDVLGGNDLELPWPEPNALAWMEVDKRIMKTRKSEQVFHAVCRYGKTEWIRAYKSPLLGRNGKVQGLSGIAIPISASARIPLTKQQTACLKHLAMGLTFKQIALALGLSPKTVEHYLDTVKIKLNCKTRQELILQAVERGLVGYFL